MDKIKIPTKQNIKDSALVIGALGAILGFLTAITAILYTT